MVWMISLKEEFANAIVEHRKFVELRTRVPSSIEVGDYVFACVAGSGGMVKLGFQVCEIIASRPSWVWSKYGNELAIDREAFDLYVEGRSIVYGLRWGYIVYRERPWWLEEFGLLHSPRWFSRVNHLPAGLEDWGVKK